MLVDAARSFEGFLSVISYSADPGGHGAGPCCKKAAARGGATEHVMLCFAVRARSGPGYVYFKRELTPNFD